MGLLAPKLLSFLITRHILSEMNTGTRTLQYAPSEEWDANPRGSERDSFILYGGITVEGATALSFSSLGQKKATSDHLPVIACIAPDGESPSLRLATWNLGGTSLSEGVVPKQDLLTALHSPKLTRAFEAVRRIPTLGLFAELAPFVGPFELRTAVLFFGFTMGSRDWTKSRAVSQILQGRNDLAILLAKLVETLAGGAAVVDAAIAVARMCSLGPSTDWLDHHHIPNKAGLDERVRHDDKAQKFANVACYFYYMATVASREPEDFKASLESAKTTPTQNDVLATLDAAFLAGGRAQETPAVAACLQEVPDFLRPRLQKLCDTRGYALVAPPPCGRPAAVILVQREHHVAEAAMQLDTHRAVATVIPGLVAGAAPTAILSIHGDLAGLTEQICGQFDRLCETNGIARRCVIGDLQIGKHSAGYDGVKCDIDTAMQEVGDIAPPMITRLVCMGSYFCPQDKNIPRPGVTPGLGRD